MKSLLKKILTAGLIVCAFLCLSPFSAFALAADEGTIRLTELDSETQSYIAGINLTLYQVTERSDAGGQGFKLTGSFENSGIGIEDLYDGKLASANVDLLDKYIEEYSIAGVQSQTSGSSGEIVFSSLPDGMYFVKQTNTPEDFQKLGYTASSESFLVEMPWTNEDGTLTRDVRCQPKVNVQYNQEEKKIVVYKVWKDNNNKTGVRPAEIRVGLYNGESLQEEVTLSAENNWMHKWTHLDKEIDWSVRELQVPVGYTSQTTEENGVFTITNTLSPTPRPSVYTGVNSDKTSLIILTVFAVYLAIIALRAVRRRNNKTAGK